MISDFDIYRSAAVLVQHHGEDAVLEAAHRADVMLDKGDLEGHSVWRRILAAVKELKREDRPKGVPLQ